VTAGVGVKCTVTVTKFGFVKLLLELFIRIHPVIS
jgi:hypothetical protein